MIYGIAIGSNVGNCAENLRRGVEMIALTPGCRVVAEAPLYETAPVDCAPGTPSFLNSVIEVECELEPHALHARLKAIESALGRPEQRAKNSPRTLDLDILYAGDRVIDDETLTIPHPRLHLRRFVLEPLADIRPELRLPGQEKTVAELLAAL